jgi:hypothetical protein
VILKLDQSVPVIKSPNKLEEDLGQLSSDLLQNVVGVLVTFMREIREVEAANGGNQCESCAFDPATDSRKGFAPTAYGVLWAIYNRKLFICHANQPDSKDNVLDTSKGVALCNGFKEVVAEHNLATARAIAERAMHAIRQIVPKKQYLTLQQALEGPEKEIILAALQRNRWNRSRTAVELDINRTTLYKKIRKYGLDEQRLGITTH